MKIVLFEKWRGALFYHCDECRRTKKGRPRGGSGWFKKNQTSKSIKLDKPHSPTVPKGRP